MSYTRASTLAGMLDDKYALHRWELRLLARGLGIREDLAALAASVPALTGDPRYDRSSNAQLDSVIERAWDSAGKDVKADWGTAIHAFSEDEVRREHVPARMRSDVVSFDQEMAGSVRVLSERFVANDELTAAGTFDGTWRIPGYGHVLGDIKTGDYKPLACAIQLACYRDGELYDAATDTRSEPWPDDLRTDVAITIHVRRGEGRTDVHEIDLDLGRQAAKEAAAVRDIRQWMTRDSGVELSRKIVVRGYVVQHLERLCGQVASSEEALALREQYRDVWTEVLNSAVRKRLAELAGPR